MSDQLLCDLMLTKCGSENADEMWFKPSGSGLGLGCWIQDSSQRSNCFCLSVTVVL